MTSTLRIESIDIEIFKPGSDPVIRVSVASVDEDGQGNIVSVSGKQTEIFKKASQVATQTETILDPVLKESVSISVAGIQAAIAQGVYRWIAEQFAGSIQGNKFILED